MTIAITNIARLGAPAVLIAAVLFAALSPAFADSPPEAPAAPSSATPEATSQATSALPASAPTPQQQQPFALDLGTAVRRAIAASPDLAAVQDALAASEASYDATLRQYAPSAVASAGYTRSSPVTGGSITVGPQTVTLHAPPQDSTSFRLGLRQPLYSGGRIEAGIAAASAAEGSARADARSVRRSVASMAERAWWALVLAAESEEAVAENYAAMKAHRADAERRLAQGTGTKNELLSWEMQEIQAGVASRAAATDLEAARARLDILLGLPWNTPIDAAPPPPPALSAGIGGIDGATPSTAALIDRALSTRPEIDSARARIAAQDAAEKLARASILPSVSLTGDLVYADPNPEVIPQQEGFAFLWDVGIVASIDVGRVPESLAQIEAARAEASQARDSLGRVRDELTLELVQDSFDLEKARDSYLTSDAAVNLAEENLRVQKDRFAAGVAIASELADAEASLLAAKLDRFRARVAWELARAALRDAAGGDAASELSSRAAAQPQGK